VGLAGAGVTADPACTGSVTNPTAPAGKLCLYVGVESLNGEPELYSTDFSTPGVGPAGALIFWIASVGDQAVGSFAVTAP
jgi:hypothetical protein